MTPPSLWNGRTVAARRRFVRRAEEAVERGALDEALDVLSPFLHAETVASDVLHVLGRIRFYQGMLDEAACAYETLLSRDSEDHAARENMRQTYIRRGFDALAGGDADVAVSDLERALALEPEDAFVLYNLGCACAESEEKAAEAPTYWERALRRRPTYVEPHFDLAQWHFHSGRYPQAAAHLEAILAERTDWPAPYYLLAAVCAQSGETVRALGYLKEAIVINAGWAKTADEDPHFRALRGNPEFESLVRTDAMVSLDSLSRTVLTEEDLARDRLAFAEPWAPVGTREAGSADE
jgi:tetratricopeptide (TPR) repeat protein